MHPTRASRSLKSLFAGYHEPAGLSSQQTVKLLNDLKASFRNQLDREYGPPQRRQASRLDASPVSGPTSVTRASAASIHLRQLLQNPVFLQKKTDTSKRDGKSGSLRDPMDVFDQAAARGVLTMKAAKGCLIAKRRQLEISPQYPKNLTDTSIGSRALQWLQTTPEYKSPQFAVDIHLLTELVPFLQAEGRIEVVWEWLSRILEASPETSERPRPGRLGLLLTRIVSAQMRAKEDSMDGAIMTLQKAEKTFAAHGLPPKELQTFLHYPWRIVSWETTVNAELDRPEPTSTLYDRHVGMADSFGDPLDVERAHLLLHHPEHPDCEPVLRLLAKRGRVEDMLRRSIAREGSTPMDCVSWLRALVQDALQYLQKRGSVAELDHLLGSLRAVFGHGVGLDRLAPVSRTQALG